MSDQVTETNNRDVFDKEIRIYGAAAPEITETEDGMFIVDCYTSIEDEEEIVQRSLTFSDRDYANFVVNAAKALHFAPYFNVDETGVFVTLTPPGSGDDDEDDVEGAFPSIEGETIH